MALIAIKTSPLFVMYWITVMADLTGLNPGNLSLNETKRISNYLQNHNDQIERNDKKQLAEQALFLNRMLQDTMVNHINKIKELLSLNASKMADLDENKQMAPLSQTSSSSFRAFSFLEPNQDVISKKQSKDYDIIVIECEELEKSFYKDVIEQLEADIRRRGGKTDKSKQIIKDELVITDGHKWLHSWIAEVHMNACQDSPRSTQDKIVANGVRLKINHYRLVKCPATFFFFPMSATKEDQSGPKKSLSIGPGSNPRHSEPIICLSDVWICMVSRIAKFVGTRNSLQCRDRNEREKTASWKILSAQERQQLMIQTKMYYKNILGVDSGRLQAAMSKTRRTKLVLMRNPDLILHRPPCISNISKVGESPAMLEESEDMKPFSHHLKEQQEENNNAVDEELKTCCAIKSGV
ncbi:hypothetical protein Btru_041623 [Bulinus truncatus]|nr:hypothetical protein Btru_041623 [Bulinus truncatus]